MLYIGEVLVLMLTTPAKPPSGVTSGGIQCFKLSYEALEGYGNLLGRKLEVKHCVVKVCL